MAKAAELGFDAVELFTASADALTTDRLTALIDQFGLNIAAVGTGAGKVVRGLTLTDPDPVIRTRAIAFITDMIGFGASVGAPAIIGSMQGNAAPGLEKEQALTWLAEGLTILGKQADEQGVPLIYEPLNRYETNLINDLTTGASFLSGLRTENVVLLADLFHMNIEETSMADSIRSTGARIGHIHFADSNRRPVGLGHTDVDAVAGALKEIGYSGYVSAEAFPFPTPDQAARQTIQSFQHYFN